MKFQTLIFTFLVAGLFLIAFVNFGNQLAIDNNANWSIRDDARINSTIVTAEQNIVSTQSVTSSGRTAFEQESIKDDAADIILPSVKSVGTTIGGTMTSMYNLIFGTAASILNIPQIVLVTIVTILVTLTVLLAWKLYRSGS